MVARERTDPINKRDLPAKKIENNAGLPLSGAERFEDTGDDNIDNNAPTTPIDRTQLPNISHDPSDDIMLDLDQHIGEPEDQGVVTYNRIPEARNYQTPMSDVDYSDLPNEDAEATAEKPEGLLSAEHMVNSLKILETIVSNRHEAMDEQRSVLRAQVTRLAERVGLFTRQETKLQRIQEAVGKLREAIATSTDPEHQNKLFQSMWKMSHMQDSGMTSIVNDMADEFYMRTASGGIKLQRTETATSSQASPYSIKVGESGTGARTRMDFNKPEMTPAEKTKALANAQEELKQIMDAKAIAIAEIDTDKLNDAEIKRAIAKINEEYDGRIDGARGLVINLGDFGVEIQKVEDKQTEKAISELAGDDVEQEFFKQGEGLAPVKYGEAMNPLTPSDIHEQRALRDEYEQTALGASKLSPRQKQDFRFTTDKSVYDVTINSPALAKDMITPMRPMEQMTPAEKSAALEPAQQSLEQAQAKLKTLLDARSDKIGEVNQRFLAGKTDEKGRAKLFEKISRDTQAGIKEAEANVAGSQELVETLSRTNEDADNAAIEQASQASMEAANTFIKASQIESNLIVERANLEKSETLKGRALRKALATLDKKISIATKASNEANANMENAWELEATLSGIPLPKSVQDSIAARNETVQTPSVDNKYSRMSEQIEAAEEKAYAEAGTEKTEAVKTREHNVSEIKNALAKKFATSNDNLRRMLVDLPAQGRLIDIRLPEGTTAQNAQGVYILSGEPGNYAGVEYINLPQLSEALADAGQLNIQTALEGLQSVANDELPTEYMSFGKIGDIAQASRDAEAEKNVDRISAELPTLKHPDANATV
ncbi:MAG: hypothetical protein Q8P90_03260 [bacterium]|nr:hypothetical protein [bacterium]